MIPDEPMIIIMDDMRTLELAAMCAIAPAILRGEQDDDDDWLLGLKALICARQS